MKKYEIIFCIGDCFKKTESKKELIKANSEREALRELYLKFWGSPVFIYSIKAMYFTILLFFSLVTNAQIKFRWTQISGPVQTLIANPDSASTLVIGLNKVGIYKFEFSVTNDFGTGRDTCTVTVIRGALGIKKDSVYHFERPQIKKLEIKMIARISDIFLEIKSPRAQTLTGAIYDAVGRALAKVEIPVNKGINHISIPKPKVAGYYILKFYSYFDNVVQKMIL